MANIRDNACSLTHPEAWVAVATNFCQPCGTAALMASADTKSASVFTPNGNSEPAPQIEHTDKWSFGLKAAIIALTRGTMNIESIDHEQGKCIFVGTRTKMITELERQVAEKFAILLALVQWRFSDATVAAALANGGTLDMTRAQVDADMIDMATEV